LKVFTNGGSHTDFRCLVDFGSPGARGDRKAWGLRHDVGSLIYKRKRSPGITKASSSWGYYSTDVLEYKWE
jgi:hypothetical protein